MTASRPLWLKCLIAVALAFALFNISAYLYGLTLPDEWQVERSVIVHAPPEAVYPLLAGPKRWTEWTEWNERTDPGATFTADGPESGEGASMSWIGREIGTGRVTIRKAEPNRSVTYELIFQGSEFTKDGQFRLEPTDAGTRVTWSDGGKIGDTLGRIFRERFEQSLAARFDEDLKQLKAVAEKENVARDSGTDPDSGDTAP